MCYNLRLESDNCDGGSSYFSSLQTEPFCVPSSSTSYMATAFQTDLRWLVGKERCKLEQQLTYV
eukprot:1721533-Amphidinium_carterae.1